MTLAAAVFVADSSQYGLFLFGIPSSETSQLLGGSYDRGGGKCENLLVACIIEVESGLERGGSQRAFCDFLCTSQPMDLCILGVIVLLVAGVALSTVDWTDCSQHMHFCAVNSARLCGAMWFVRIERSPFICVSIANTLSAQSVKGHTPNVHSASCHSLQLVHCACWLQ